MSQANVYGELIADSIHAVGTKIPVEDQVDLYGCLDYYIDARMIIKSNKATINTTATANGGSAFIRACYWGSTAKTILIMELKGNSGNYILIPVRINNDEMYCSSVHNIINFRML